MVTYCSNKTFLYECIIFQNSLFKRVALQKHVDPSFPDNMHMMECQHIWDPLILIRNVNKTLFDWHANDTTLYPEIVSLIIKWLLWSLRGNIIILHFLVLSKRPSSSLLHFFWPIGPTWFHGLLIKAPANVSTRLSNKQYMNTSN